MKKIKVYLKTKNGTDAQGLYDPAKHKITLLKGSVLAIDLNGQPSENIKGNYRQTREFCDQGHLSALPDGRWQMENDMPDLSPSAAYVIASGKSGSGPENWKPKDDNRPITQIRQDYQNQVMKNPNRSRIGHSGCPRNKRTPAEIDTGQILGILKSHTRSIQELAPQVIRVGGFYACYDRLLTDPDLGFAEDWARVKEFLEEQNSYRNANDDSKITRDVLKTAANTWVNKHWARLFIFTMIWGYGGAPGKEPKDGPAKLYMSLRTKDSRAIIDKCANLVTEGKLQESFAEFCKGVKKLDQVGPAFGTKFLFSVGLPSSEETTKPLIYDSRIFKSLKALGYPARETDRLTSDGYVQYCEFMKTCSDDLGCKAYDLEQFLFTNGEGKIEKVRARLLIET